MTGDACDLRNGNGNPKPNGGAMQCNAMEWDAERHRYAYASTAHAVRPARHALRQSTAVHNCELFDSIHSLYTVTHDTTRYELSVRVRVSVRVSVKSSRVKSNQISSECEAISRVHERQLYCTLEADTASQSHSTGNLCQLNWQLRCCCCCCCCQL